MPAAIAPRIIERHIEIPADYHRLGAILRVPIDLLADRLRCAANWLADQTETCHLRLGYFGASTGAAAALQASTYQSDNVGAVVCRGGRPDLAMTIVGNTDRDSPPSPRQATSRALIWPRFHSKKTSMFRNRNEAGGQLAERLKKRSFHRPPECCRRPPRFPSIILGCGPVRKDVLRYRPLRDPPPEMLLLHDPNRE